MQLSRRDALAVLAGTGIVGGSVGAALSRAVGRDGPGALGGPARPGPTDGPGGNDIPADLDEIRETLVAVAELVYPSTVTGIPAFVETYSLGRIRDRASYREGVADATRTLDEYARDWYDAPFADLDEANRDDVLRRMGADAADPAPDGIDAQRVRFYVVNDLQYALYTSPTGGKLVGIENPQGYAGGTRSYQQGPNRK